MQNHSLQVHDGNMLLLPFQSGCETRIQAIRTHTCVLAVSVSIHTDTSLPDNVLYCHQLFILQCHSWLSNLLRVHDIALLNEQSYI